MHWLIVGISGVTCGGKTTLAKTLLSRIPGAHHICQDTYFLPKDSEKHVLIKELNHFNWELITALDMDKMHEDILEITGKQIIGEVDVCGLFGESTPRLERLSKDDIKVLIVEGFSIFLYEPIAKLCSIKVFLTLPRSECYRRRCLRTYDPPDVPGYFDICVWPEHLRQYNTIREKYRDILFWDERVTDRVERILNLISKMLQNL